jgi:hypothetical protein
VVRESKGDVVDSDTAVNRGHGRRLRYGAVVLVAGVALLGTLLFVGSARHGLRPTAGGEPVPPVLLTSTATPTTPVTAQTTAPDVVVTTPPRLTPPPDPVRGNTWSAIAEPCGSHEGTQMRDPNDNPTTWQTPFPVSCGWWYHQTSPQGGHPMDWDFTVAFEGDCAIEVHIPDDPLVTAPMAHYVVLDGPGGAIRSIVGFKVDQVKHRGTWFPVGTYHTTGYLAVRLDDRGDGTTNVVADTVRVNCRRS